MRAACSKKVRETSHSWPISTIVKKGTFYFFKKQNVPFFGFTLIEVMAVIVIMGLLAGVAALTFARPLAASRARNAQDQILSLDSSARQFARRFGRPVEVAFDFATQTIARRERDEIVFSARLPGGCRIEEIRVNGRDESLGEIAIPISSNAMSQSYAVHLVGQDLDRWLVVAGLSGQVTQINDVATLDQILPTATSRDDAD
jgi:prepilin-type N-terminal cleavage/methylation domain-containing protein